MSELRNKVFSIGPSMLLGSSLVFGLELGFFTALGNRRYTSQELAEHLRLDPRYTQEWLLHMRANSIICHEDDSYWLNDEQRDVLLDEGAKQYALGVVQFAFGCNLLHPLLMERWQNDVNTNNKGHQTGIAYNELNDHVTSGLRRWFTVNYLHLLKQHWIPSIDQKVLQTVDAGSANVADVGCGHGTATLQLATRFNKAHVYGFDYDPISLRIAADLAATANLPNVSFQQAGAADFVLPDGGKFDLIFFFAAFHDMSNPAAIVRHVKKVLAPGGAVVLLEPYAGDTLEETCKHPGAALFAGVSLHYCTACAKIHSTGPGDLVMGAVAPNSVYEQLWIKEGGFKSMKMLTPPNTPNNRLFEIRMA